MTDLRDRLAALAHYNHCQSGCKIDSSWHVYFTEADAALAVFAEWLRERADAVRVAGGESAVAEWAAKRFYDAADELESKESQNAEPA